MTDTTTGHGAHRELVGYAADALITRRRNAKIGPEILMVKRGHFPFVGAWAFPGGYVDGNETARQAAAFEPVADDDAAAAQWLGIRALLAGELGEIAFDHADVIRDLLAKPFAKHLIHD